MTTNQRMVWVQMLLAANWAPSEVWVSGQRVEVPRGSFIDAQETLAADAGVSRKVVRQTICQLESEGAIRRATVGRQKGHCITLVTIVNYERYQNVRDPEGQGWDSERAIDRAEGGPEEGQRRAPSEPDQPDQPELLPAPRPASSPPPQAPSAVVLTLPCIGTGPREFAVTDAQLDKWRAAFPGIDVLAEVRKAGVWLDASPARRKTHGGMAKFLVGWLGRSQNGPRVNGAHQQQPAAPARLAPLGAPGAP